MELVRNLPASMAAPRLAGPWVGLAAAGRMPDAAVDRIRDLTGALLEHASSRLDPQTNLELRVLPRERVVRVEVRWRATNREAERSDRRRDGRVRSWSRVRGLADRCGLTRGRDRSCVWAESSAVSTQKAAHRRTA
jgi:hypothetical protein